MGTSLAAKVRGWAGTDAPLYWLVGLASCVPIFLVKYPPIQDLPFHLATTRVINDYGDPAFGFGEDFALGLGRTQYVLYYILTSAVAHVVGIRVASALLLSVYLGGTVLAMRALLRALGRDPRLALLAPPMLVNVMLLFGLLPFLLGIPVMLWGAASARRYFERPSVVAGLATAAMGASLFYLHMFPFALFAIAYAAAFPWRRPRAWPLAALPAVPAVALVGWFTFLTDEGKLARGALFHPERPSPLGPLEKVKDAFNWLGDVWRDPSDEILWGLTLALALAALVLGFRERGEGPRARLLSYAVVPLACALLFVIGGEQHGHIWLIWQRFPLLFCVTAIPLLRFPKGRAGKALTVGLVALGLASATSTAVHFVRFQRDDVEDFDGALAVMEPRKHVAGLIYDPLSSVAFRHPLVHFASYYQLEKGGVVEFTFAGYPHWPFSFKDGRCPPIARPPDEDVCRARLNWEWTPGEVGLDELYPYFDYVLTRGEGFAPPADRYRMKWQSGRWRVWEKV